MMSREMQRVLECLQIGYRYRGLRWHSSDLGVPHRYDLTGAAGLNEWR